MIKIYLDFIPGTNRVFSCGSAPLSPNDVLIEVDESHEVLKTPLDYIYVDGELVPDNGYLIEEHRKTKDAELNDACNKAILAGFDYTLNGVSYHFSFDTEAQLNFQGVERLLSKGTIPSIDWTVKNNATGLYQRIAIDAQIMDDLSLAILKHKSGNVSKYRDVLYPRLMRANSLKDIDDITW